MRANLTVMRVPLSWISDFLVDIPDAEACAEILTRQGLEVSEINKPAVLHPNIVVGKILEVVKHPNADRLSICQVEVGQEQPLSIVCGAPNVQEGQKVAAALPGTVLANGLKIKLSKIRGTPSQGMLCSAAELGLSEESDGIFVLPPEDSQSLALGSALSKVLEEGETTLELEISPNRPDALSIVGIARELAVALNQSLEIPSSTTLNFGSKADFTVVRKDPKACPAYLGLAMKNASMGPSPAKIVRRLEACGIRSLGSIVDATNYVLLELGHPVHVFDRDLLNGRQISIRRALKGESILGLTGESYSLDPSDLVIADEKGPVALAGITGGQATGVTPDTRNLFLECATFEASGIRRTGRRLNLSTESSFRFERGVPAFGLPTAMARLAELLQQWSHAEVHGDALISGDTDFKGKALSFSPKKAIQRLGLDKSSKAAENPGALLTRLGFQVEGSENALKVTPPPHRIDILEEADIWDELARTDGLDSIQETQPRGSLPRRHNDPVENMLSKAKSFLVGAGYSEIISGSLLSTAANSPTSLGPTLVLSNPIGPETASLRGSLWPGLITAGAHNLSRGRLDLRLFESGHIFAGTPGQISEEIWIGGLMSGERHPGAWGPSQATDLFDLKGLVESLSALLSFPLDWGQETPEGCSPERGWTIHSNNHLLGRAGEVVPPEGLLPPGSSAVYMFEFSLSKAVGMRTQILEATPPPRFPRVDRDLSFVVPDKISAQSVLQLVKKSAGKSLEDMQVKDVYRGAQVPAGHRSITVQLFFRAADRTLRDQEIDERIAAITGNVKQEFNAEVRGSDNK